MSRWTEFRHIHPARGRRSHGWPRPGRRGDRAPPSPLSPGNSWRRDLVQLIDGGCIDYIAHALNIAVAHRFAPCPVGGRSVLKGLPQAGRPEADVHRGEAPMVLLPPSPLTRLPAFRLSPPPPRPGQRRRPSEADGNQLEEVEDRAREGASGSAPHAFLQAARIRR